MANLKNITDLPVAESADGLNLIVNDNGAAKQIAASAVGAQADWNVTDETNPAFIKNKPEIQITKKELMYEWNFEAVEGNTVSYIMENTDDDLSWITSPESEADFEFEVAFYCFEYDGNVGITGMIPDCFVCSTVPNSVTKIKSQKDELLSVYMELYGQMPSYETTGYPYCDICINNKKHIDDDGNYISVDSGGLFEMYSDTYWPFKSFKIYKVTR